MPGVLLWSGVQALLRIFVMWYSSLEYELANGEPWFPSGLVGLLRECDRQRPASEGDRICLQLHIPAHCHPQPVISDLVKDYDVAITILSASLPSQGDRDGWFELELWGLPQQLEAAVATLNQSDFALWLQP